MRTLAATNGIFISAKWLGGNKGCTARDRCKPGDDRCAEAHKKLLSSEDAAIALLLQQMPAPRDQHGPKDKDDDRIWLNCAASPPTMCRCMLSTT